MNSLREIIESSPSVRHLAFANKLEGDEPQALAPARWDWTQGRRVLGVRLRSIGATVPANPLLVALRRFLPQAQIDILLEDWVAPVLEGSDLVDRVIAIARDSTAARARLARELRAARYDVVYNLHGGTTATLLTRATGAKHRVGFGHYQYARLHNHAAPSSLEIWQRSSLHSVEQQLALTESSLRAVSEKLRAAGWSDQERPFAMLHPAAAFDTKQWATENFARV